MLYTVVQIQFLHWEDNWSTAGDCMEVLSAPLGLMAETGLEPATFQLQAPPPPPNDHWTTKLLI